MAVSHDARIDANFGFSGTTTVSASKTWTNGELITFMICNRISGTGVSVPSSIAGSTMTFTRVTTLDQQFTLSSTNDTMISLWVAIGNGNTETVTATFGASQQDGFWFAEAWTAGTAFTNATGSIRQAVKGSGSSTTMGSSLNLAALRDANSMGVLCLSLNSNTSPSYSTWGGTSYGQAGHSSPTNLLFSGGFKVNSTAVQATWGGSLNWGAHSFEILDPSGGGSPPTNTVAPVVSGITQVGQTLSSTTGTWV